MARSFPSPLAIFIRRRRALAVFSPLSLSPNLWLRADSGLSQDAGGSTPASADGERVRRWADLSGHGRHATAASDGARGTLKLSQVNGQPVVRFDGVDDLLTAPVPASAAKTLVVVARFIGEAGGGSQAVAGYGGSAVLYKGGGAASPLWYDGTSDVSLDGDFATWQAVILRFSDTSSALGYLNGGAPLASFNPDDSYAVATALGIGDAAGGGLPGNYDVAEVLEFGALTDEELNLLGAYLAERYGLGWVEV